MEKRIRDFEMASFKIFMILKENLTYLIMEINKSHTLKNNKIDKKKISNYHTSLIKMDYGEKLRPAVTAHSS